MTRDLPLAAWTYVRTLEYYRTTSILVSRVRTRILEYWYVLEYSRRTRVRTQVRTRRATFGSWEKHKLHYLINCCVFTVLIENRNLKVTILNFWCLVIPYKTRWPVTCLRQLGRTYVLRTYTRVLHGTTGISSTYSNIEYSNTGTYSSTLDVLEYVLKYAPVALRLSAGKKICSII